MLGVQGQGSGLSVLLLPGALAALGQAPPPGTQVLSIKRSKAIRGPGNTAAAAAVVASLPGIGALVLKEQQQQQWQQDVPQLPQLPQLAVHAAQSWRVEASAPPNPAARLQGSLECSARGDGLDADRVSGLLQPPASPIPSLGQGDSQSALRTISHGPSSGQGRKRKGRAGSSKDEGAAAGTDPGAPETLRAIVSGGVGGVGTRHGAETGTPAPNSARTAAHPATGASKIKIRFKTKQHLQ